MVRALLADAIVRRLVVASLILLAPVCGETQAPSPLDLVANSYGFMPPLFIAPPPGPATDLLLVGETPVFQMHVTVVNTGEFTRVLNAPRRNLNVVVRAFPDKQLIDIPRPIVSGPVRVYESTMSVTWDPLMRLAARESLEWTVDLQLQSVPPGIYVLEVVLPATDDNGANITRRASWVGLEIREGQDDRTAAEIALRTRLRLVHEGRLTEALDVATDATVRFPNSAVLHTIVGDVYERLGRRAEATRSYSRALTIVETGREYPMPFRPRDARESMRFLSSKIAQLR